MDVNGWGRVLGEDGRAILRVVLYYLIVNFFLLVKLRNENFGQCNR